MLKSSELICEASRIGEGELGGILNVMGVAGVWSSDLVSMMSVFSVSL